MTIVQRQPEKGRQPKGYKYLLGGYRANAFPKICKIGLDSLLDSNVERQWTVLAECVYRESFAGVKVRKCDIIYSIFVL
jgi:hypothetical protein